MTRELQEEFDPHFNQMEWRAQRVGWVLIILILLATVIGLFGGGFFSQATARHEGDGYEVVLQYPRFGRAESTLELQLEVVATGVTDGQVMATLSGDMASKVTITNINPEPESESLEGESVVYAWDVEDWSQPLVVQFEYEARDWRMLDGRFEISAGDESLGAVSFEQFLFP